jgi:signal peptidase
MTALRWTRRTLDAILLVALVAVALTAGVALLASATGGRAMVIGGGSMEPTIPKGSLILAVPADDYAVGDVVAVQHGGSTPYTHRITRLAELDGVPYVETKGDANEGPDPAIVPVASMIGRVDVSLPLLGYLGLLLGSMPGLVAFVALGGSLLLASGALEEWENGRCPVCAAAGPDSAVDVAAGAVGHAALPPRAPRARAARPVARGPARTRVRETGRARDPQAPVLLERDRRNPRRHGIASAPIVTAPVVPALPAARAVQNAGAARAAGLVAPTAAAAGIASERAA